jgi:HSP20 family protein
VITSNKKEVKQKMVEEKKETVSQSGESKDVEVVPKKKESALSLRPYDLWSEMDRLFEDFMSNFDEFFWSPFTPRRRRSSLLPWRTGAITYREPYVDVLDTGKEFKLSAELPGVSKDNVDITVTEDAIEISAKVSKEEKEEKEGYLRQERAYSEFYRKMTLPEEIIPDKSEAKLENGVLEITLPKKKPTPEPKKHKLEIK